MKKIAIVLVLILVAASVFANGPKDINGYDWVTFSYEEKVMFTLGVLAGISQSNILLLGYDADGITLAKMAHVESIIEMVDRGYAVEETRSLTVVMSIAVAWNILRG